MLPPQFQIRMKKMLQSEYEEFLQSYERTRFFGLRRNSLKLSEEEFFTKLPFEMKRIPWCADGYYYEEEEQPGKHPFHEAGLYYIQEPSAMSVAEYLQPQPGERVLDLCAAPGGKSTALAASMKQKGILICNEIHPARAKVLSENIERMGVANAVVTNETPEKLAEHFKEYFDKILVDAPCSGEGMFRKNQEAVEEWSCDNVRMCAERQDDILKEAAKMLRPGGILCYSTCTFSPEENEGCAERFLKKNPDFYLLQPEIKEGMTEGNPLWTKNKDPEIKKTLRLWPHKLQGEGHFIALYQKKEAAGERRSGKGSIEEPVKRVKDVKELEEFLKNNTRVELPDHILSFGQQLYLLPQECPMLKGLKVLRPGLHLGSLKKNRFEPSHAFALYLKGEQVKHTYNMKAKSCEIKQYIAGNTLSHQGEKGWYLMLVEGYSIGWAKLAGGVLKNHYPKGLRKQ